MKRTIPFVLVAVAACADDTPFAPAGAAPRPLASVVSFDNAGGVTFSEDTDCTYDAATNSFTCSYTVQNLPAEPASAIVAAYWKFQWICVHHKTGKASKNAIPTWRTGGAGHYGHVSAMPIGGQLSASDIVLEAPVASSYAWLCSANKGPNTQVKFIAPPEPWFWTVEAWNEDEPDAYWANMSVTM